MPEDTSSVLDISVVWRENEDQAPAAVRDAIESLLKVLNEYGLEDVVETESSCGIQCGVFKIKNES